jgi:hypothetical protein
MSFWTKELLKTTCHSLQGLLHLLGDYREQTGLGESEFLRGACWFAPIERIVNAD